jgi:hypothetical protein
MAEAVFTWEMASRKSDALIGPKMISCAQLLQLDDTVPRTSIPVARYFSYMAAWRYVLAYRSNIGFIKFQNE